MSNKRIIEKMKKLLAMTESKNENEALSATRKLHAMLAKHNISIDSLHTEDNAIGRDSEHQVCRPWKRSVAGAIARLYFCDFYYTKYGKKSDYVFVGTESNRIFAIHIFKMVIQVVERTARVESKAIYGKEDCSFVNSFWTGAKNRIVERCEDLMAKGKEGTLEDEDGTTLPALMDIYKSMEIKIEGFYKEIGMDLKPAPTRTRITDHNGYNKGKETGDKVQLSRSLQSNESPKLIGN